MGTAQEVTAVVAHEPDSLLSWEALRGLIPLSRPQVWRLRSAGQFPQPIRISRNRIAWKASDVRRWIASRPSA